MTRTRTANGHAGFLKFSSLATVEEVSTKPTSTSLRTDRDSRAFKIVLVQHGSRQAKDGSVINSMNEVYLDHDDDDDDQTETGTRYSQEASKRSKNPFFQFRSDPCVKARYLNDTEQCKIVQKMSIEWNSLTDDEKLPYQEKAAKAARAHRRLLQTTPKFKPFERNNGNARKVKVSWDTRMDTTCTSLDTSPRSKSVDDALGSTTNFESYFCSAEPERQMPFSYMPAAAVPVFPTCLGSNTYMPQLGYPELLTSGQVSNVNWWPWTVPVATETEDYFQPPEFFLATDQPRNYVQDMNQFLYS